MVKFCTHLTADDHSAVSHRGVRIWRCGGCQLAQPWGRAWGYHGNVECKRCQTAQVDVVYCSKACRRALQVRVGTPP